MKPLVDLMAEERRLVRQYGVVRRRAERIEDEVGDEVGLGAEGGPKEVGTSGADDVLLAWLDMYPNLTATEVFTDRIPQVVEQLVAALAGLPPMPRGSLSEEQAGALKAVFEPVRRAVLVVEQYVYGVAALRSVIATATGEEDMNIVDAYVVVGGVMTSPEYTNFDRIKVKLTRRTVAGKKKLAEYNAKESSIAKRAEWVKKKREEDPEYRQRENIRRREKYAEKKSFKLMMTEMIAAIERDHPEPQMGVS